MKNKFIVGALSGLLILGGAVAVGASKSDTRAEDSIHQEDKKVSGNVNGKEQGQTTIKVEADDSNSTAAANANFITMEKAKEIAISKVNGTVVEIEQELEHGRMEYKVELNTSTGEAEVRIDAETGKVVRVERDDDKVSDDDTKSDDGAHQNRHSGDDDNKADDGAHQNRHSGDDDNKADDGAHQNRHSGDDDNKADDGAHQNRHSGDDDNKADDGAHQNRHSGDDDNKADDDTN
ncbi:PepSY domain-containing protein [Bacillus sp. X1(2014)]|uniref:PepSY domain-containing protein n=1 Tax=Bacillus sp. X1(2014) TaxID=1565991 RepID=UPI00119C9C7E|nr:PepSY domain-containing protein [Bacillus sp. X1(2014)]